ncbi:MAG: Hsp20/alpha crystallin family protein [Opitutae bacterium]|nr:Hsp20/alpha crystallin family protein [Opitutae bacterium]
MINPPSTPSPRPAAKPARPSRPPRFESIDGPQTLELKVYVPGVDASGVEIITLGPDLGITARRTRPVRGDCPAPRPEAARGDYQLRLRLGAGYDFTALQADLAGGVLTLRLPKAPPAAARAPSSHRRVA